MGGTDSSSSESGKTLGSFAPAQLDAAVMERDFQAMTETRQQWWLWPLLLLLLPLVVVAGVLWVMAAVLLQLVVWLTWCSRGRYVLVVYSDSPIWQRYLSRTCSRPWAAGASFSTGRTESSGRIRFR